MTQRIRKQNREGLATSLERLAESVVKGIGSLLGFAAEMERQGKSEHIEQGEIKGKTKSGKEYRGTYGLRVKIGLNPEDFKGRKKLSDGKK